MEVCVFNGEVRQQKETRKMKNPRQVQGKERRKEGERRQ